MDPTLPTIFTEVGEKAGKFAVSSCYDKDDDFVKERKKFAKDMVAFLKKKFGKIVEKKDQKSLISFFEEIFTELSYSIPCTNYSGATEKTQKEDRTKFSRYIADYAPRILCTSPEHEEAATILGLQGEERDETANIYCERVSRDYNSLVKPIDVEDRHEPLYSDPTFLRARTSSWYRRNVPDVTEEYQKNSAYIAEMIQRQEEDPTFRPEIDYKKLEGRVTKKYQEEEAPGMTSKIFNACNTAYDQDREKLDSKQRKQLEKNRNEYFNRCSRARLNAARLTQPNRKLYNAKSLHKNDVKREKLTRAPKTPSDKREERFSKEIQPENENAERIPQVRLSDQDAGESWAKLKAEREDEEIDDIKDNYEERNPQIAHMTGKQFSHIIRRFVRDNCFIFAEETKEANGELDAAFCTNQGVVAEKLILEKIGTPTIEDGKLVIEVNFLAGLMRDFIKRQCRNWARSSKSCSKWMPWEEEEKIDAKIISRGYFNDARAMIEDVLLGRYGTWEQFLAGE